MNRIVLVLMMMMSAVAAVAQGTVKGKVVDRQTNEVCFHFIRPSFILVTFRLICNIIENIFSYRGYQVILYFYCCF